MSKLSLSIRNDFVERAKLNWKAKIKAFFSGGRRKYLNKMWESRSDLRLQVFQQVFAQNLISADEYFSLTRDDRGIIDYNKSIIRRMKDDK